MKVLSRNFYERNTQVVAFELIGKILTLEENGSVLSGRIVETEAYFGAQDPASHAYRGSTPRNQVMFGPPGVSYVYFTYGNHHCLNVVTEAEYIPGAVLIRAVEPLCDIEIMKERRRRRGRFETCPYHELTNGPGKLTQAFGITCQHSGINLTQGPLRIAEAEESEPMHIGVAKRIGISRARNSLLRFYEMGNPFVSVK